jgi:hypothetical protein
MLDYVRPVERAKEDDPAFGQIVIVTARWILVVAGFLLALWNPTQLHQLQLVLAFVLLLAVGNFFLHARLLTRHEESGSLPIAYATSVADLAVISIIVATLGGGASSLFVFYFPAILAFSVAFKPSITYPLTAGTMVVYTGIAAVTTGLGQAELVQLLMMAGVAVCGSVYWGVERDRSAETKAEGNQPKPRSELDQAVEDVFFGQLVMIWARWFVILAGAIVIFWSASSIAALSIGVLPVVCLMAMNFYLHGRYLLERPANRQLIGLAAGLDLAIISLIVLLGALGGAGLRSPFFVFYYPVILGFALVFRPKFTALFSGATLLAYAIFCAVDGMSFNPADGDLKVLVVRLITLATMAGLGTFYWRILRRRRAAAAGS